MILINEGPSFTMAYRVIRWCSVLLSPSIVISNDDRGTLVRSRKSNLSDQLMIRVRASAPLSSTCSATFGTTSAPWFWCHSRSYSNAPLRLIIVSPLHSEGCTTVSHWHYWQRCHHSSHTLCVLSMT